MQDSIIELGQDPPPAKRPRNDDNDVEEEEEGEVDSPLVLLSEVANAYLESAFKSKLDNLLRKSKATKFRTPDSCWIRCPKWTQWRQRMWLKKQRGMTVLPVSCNNFGWMLWPLLVMLLERDEELQLPVEAIQMVQTSILLMGNASFHHSTERRRALLQHLNPQLKQLVEESDFKNAAPVLFGDDFGAIVKQRLEAAAALKKTLAPSKWKQGFRQSHPHQNWGRGGGRPLTSGQGRGWQYKSNKAPGKAPQPRRWLSVDTTCQIDSCVKPINSCTPILGPALYIQLLIQCMNQLLTCLALAGRVAHFQENWEMLTNDQWVLQIVAGYQIELSKTPCQTSYPHPMMGSKEEQAQITTEVAGLLAKGAIQKTHLLPESVVSQIFLVEKKDGGQRLVVNLKCSIE